MFGGCGQVNLSVDSSFFKFICGIHLVPIAKMPPFQWIIDESRIGHGLVKHKAAMLLFPVQIAAPCRGCRSKSQIPSAAINRDPVMQQYDVDGSSGRVPAFDGDLLRIAELLTQSVLFGIIAETADDFQVKCGGKLRRASSSIAATRLRTKTP